MHCAPLSADPIPLVEPTAPTTIGDVIDLDYLLKPKSPGAILSITFASDPETQIYSAKLNDRGQPVVSLDGLHWKLAETIIEAWERKNPDVSRRAVLRILAATQGSQPAPRQNPEKQAAHDLASLILEL